MWPSNESPIDNNMRKREDVMTRDTNRYKVLCQFLYGKIRKVPPVSEIFVY